MKPVLYIFMMTAALSWLSTLYGQNAAYPDLVFKPNIRTVQVLKGGVQMSQPVIELGSDQYFEFKFDDVEGVTHDYSYKIIHCNYDWTPSDLVFMQYMTGFESYFIPDYTLSRGTSAQYVTYTFKFPNEYMTPIRSGNYLVKVYSTDNENDVIFTRRFMICEPLLSFSALLRNSSLVETRSTGQEIYFSFDISQFTINDKFNDLKVNIQQNNRWDNAIIGMQPRYISGNTMDYNYSTGQNVFEAGNQWRFIDLKTLRFAVPPIRKILFDNGRYHMLVDQEANRSEISYLANQDINGKMTIYSQDFLGINIDPDYGFVYFSIAADSLYNTDVYVLGEFSFGNLLPEYKMTYNATSGTYEMVTTLKQGYYNYMYVTVPRGATKSGSTVQFEGSYQETENDYTVYVYVREPGDVAHRLVAVETANSLTDRG